MGKKSSKGGKKATRKSNTATSSASQVPDSNTETNIALESAHSRPSDNASRIPSPSSPSVPPASSDSTEDADSSIADASAASGANQISNSRPFGLSLCDPPPIFRRPKLPTWGNCVSEVYRPPPSPTADHLGAWDAMRAHMAWKDYTLHFRATLELFVNRLLSLLWSVMAHLDYGRFGRVILIRLPAPHGMITSPLKKLSCKSSKSVGKQVCHELKPQPPATHKEPSATVTSKRPSPARKKTSLPRNKPSSPRIKPSPRHKKPSQPRKKPAAAVSSPHSIRQQTTEEFLARVQEQGRERRAREIAATNRALVMQPGMSFLNSSERIRRMDEAPQGNGHPASNGTGTGTAHQPNTGAVHSGTPTHEAQQVQRQRRRGSSLVGAPTAGPSRFPGCYSSRTTTDTRAGTSESALRPLATQTSTANAMPVPPEAPDVGPASPDQIQSTPRAPSQPAEFQQITNTAHNSSNQSPGTNTPRSAQRPRARSKARAQRVQDENRDPNAQNDTGGGRPGKA